MVLSGSGAAGVAIIKILQAEGAGQLVACDRNGVLHKGRAGLDESKRWVAEHTNPDGLTGTLRDALAGADVFVGVSGPGILEPEDIATMGGDAIVFALANPDPEVDPAGARRHAAVVATGRSDEPNQINNVLAFPGVFRGALDAGAHTISEPMKVAAARAIAARVHDDELRPDYIVPSVFDRGVAPGVAAAVRQAAADDPKVRPTGVGGACQAPRDWMIPGIDLAGVTGWFEANVAGARPPLRVAQIAGGRSNLTYRVEDAAGSSWVLRRPPLHGVLPSAHDMGREHRVISALAGTPVPVPATFGLCEDPAVTGAPFYVMGFVDGIVPRDEATVAAGLDEPARAAAAGSLVDALVALHQVDPEQVGLGQLGRHHGYLERQLARWQRQLAQTRTRPLPALDEVHRRLAANLPAQAGPARIVHGDFRLDNVVLSPAGQVLAVLDWELCTLGDPLADLGLLQVYWAEPGDRTLPLGSAPTVMPGFPGRAAVAEAYATLSGRDLSQLDIYVAFASWKLAVILEGVVARHATGAYGEGDDSWRGFAEVVEQLADRALELTGGR